MAAVYAALIRKGRKTLEDAPELLRPQIRAILQDLEAESVSE